MNKLIYELSQNCLRPPKKLNVFCLFQTEDKSSLRSSGAIIESMYHHGQGVFSGTFSGEFLSK